MASSHRLANKVALVLGSTQGIGFSIAERFLKDGAKVMIASRKADNVKRALAQLSSTAGKENVSGMVCHVGDSQHRASIIQQTVETYGKIDILLNNVAVNPHVGRTMDTSEQAWDKIFDVNVKSAFFLVKDAYPHLARNASVILTSTTAAYLGFPMVGAYVISKTALLGVVKVLAAELGPEGIRVNGIAPGLFRTKFGHALTSHEEASQYLLSITALQRLGEPEDCAGTASFLASDDSRFITGEIICINGGMSSRL